MKNSKIAKPLKQLKLSVPLQETPISSFLTASGTFHDGDLLLNQKGLRLISEEKESRLSSGKELELEFSLEDLETIKVIGKGSGGIVQLVRHKWVGTLFALKVIQMNVQEEIRKQIVQELKINQASQCSHVVVCHHSFYHNGAFSLVLEYMDRGSLADVIRQIKTILEPYLAVVCKQVLLGLVYLHNERHVIHRDIKPSNLLVNHKGEVKITDFGVSAVLASSVGQMHKSTCFEPPRKYPHPLSLSHYDLLEQSLPFYNLLKRHVRRITPSPPLPVPANEKVLAWVGDEILPRESAKVSVFDSVVQGGDSVWEGLRVYNGKVFKLEEHLDRMFDSAKALAFVNVPTREEVKDAVFKTLIRNGMFDNAHIRLSLTRGKKVTSGMSPAFNLYGCTLIVLPEWKPPVYDNTHGITLVTATTRRNSPNNLDSKIHHNNLLNNILAKIEGNNASADDAIMLDKDGYVSETNATNIFMVKKGRVLTPHADYCLPGITRATVMELVVKENIVLEERRLSLSEFHTADEAWTTGTMGELSPVIEIDGRIVCDGKVGPVTRQLQAAYKNLTDISGVPIPTFDNQK